MDAETLRARREQRRTELRRRRRRAGALSSTLLVIVVAAMLGALNSGKGSGAARSTATPVLSTHRSAHRRAPAAGAAASVRRRGPDGTQAVPILMFHVIAAPPPGAPFPGLYVTPAEFSEEMHALKAAGWHAVTLDQVAAYWHQGVALGAGKPIVVSFDNGYQSQYTQALPVMRELGWVGVENLQLTGLPPSQGGLGQQEIHGLVAAGWELDTQGFSHADLITLDAQQLRYQVAEARTVMRRRYGVPVNWFCYPSGHYDDTVIDEVKAAGYVGSTTVVAGWAHAGDDPYRLHRLRVLGGTSGAQLLVLLADEHDAPPAPPSYGGA
jgi:peptidoglycan/xylan/chitin deacetylase (PgdA/CDA1 family)